MRRIVLTALLLIVVPALAGESGLAQKKRPKETPPQMIEPAPLSLPEGVVRRTETELRQSALKRVVPDYPFNAKKKLMSGFAVIAILVNEEGQVVQAKAQSGQLDFKGESEAAARRWRFPPFLVDGKPKPVTGMITFLFNFEERYAPVVLTEAELRERAVKTAIPVRPNVSGEDGNTRVIGDVTLKVKIDEAGRVRQAWAITGPKLLHEVAVQTALKWRFRPVTRNKKPATGFGELTIHIEWGQ